MKIKLLNNGCYYCDNNVTYPCVVEAVITSDNVMCWVTSEELRRVGFDETIIDDSPWPFVVGSECEVLS